MSFASRELRKSSKFPKIKRRDKEAQNKEADDEFQPKIIVLRKPENILEPKANEADESKSLVTPEPAERHQQAVARQAMKQSKMLVVRNKLDTDSLPPFLDLDNSNFLVVGVVGMKNSGKSMLLNLLATGTLHACGDNAKQQIFKGVNGGNSIELFITNNRIFLLDTAPIYENTSGREFIVSEADDIRQIQAMLRLCHELLIVYENHQILNIVRLLICAKRMMNPYECDEPVVTLVENFTRPGSAPNPMTEIAKRLLTHNSISDNINCIKLPDFGFVTPNHEDPLETIEQLRDDINTRKELKSFDDPKDTEKCWWESFTKMSMEGGYFLKAYEDLRDKYYQ